MSRAGKGGGKGSSSKTRWWLWRALGRARDLYVRSLNGCAGLLPPDAAAFPCPSSSAFACSRYGYHHDDGGGGFSSSSSSSFSRSFSASSSSSSRDGHLRELLRAASERRAAERRPPAAVARSRSVAMARIDEDRPSEFPGLAGGGAGAAAFGRSRSCAVAGGGRRGGRAEALA